MPTRGRCVERLVQEHPLVPAYQERLARVRVVAAIAWIQRGDHERASAEVEGVVGMPAVEGQALYNAVCVYATASCAAQRDKDLPQAKREQLVEKYQARAVELLKKTDDTGLFRVAAFRDLLKNDHDLDPLRGREDFKKQCREIEAHASKGP